MSTDCTNFINQTLLLQGMEYHKKAEYYRNNGELEGALINYLLSTSNLYNWREYYNQYSHEKTEQQNADMRQVDDTLTKNIQYIVPLQEKLKQIKKNRNCPEDDKNETKCTDVSTIKRGSIRFDDISGQVSAKEQIKQGILYPLLFPKLYPYLSKGILFYGPPGTGKTLLAKAFANELQSLSIEYNMNVKVLFYAPEGGQLKGKYVGETEKNIEKYFNCASKQASACQSDPDLKKPGSKLNPCNLPEGNSKVISVIFLDEVEAIAGDRSRDTSGLMTNSVNALLQKMDGVSSLSNVVVMAATNYPWSLDDAILRRFDTKIYITLPTRTDVINLIKIDIAKYIKKILFYDTASIKPKSNDEFSMEGDCNANKCPDQTCCGGVCLHSDSNTSTDINNEDIFNFYRKLYFPSLSDTQLQNIADLYVKNNFSGGDISNALKAVFRDMGKTAFDQKKWVETQIQKYTPNSNGPKSYIKVPGKEENYKFELYSNTAKRSSSNDDYNSRYPDTEFALWFKCNSGAAIDLQSNNYEKLFTLDDSFHLNEDAYTSKINIPEIAYDTKPINERFSMLTNKWTITAAAGAAATLSAPMSLAIVMPHILKYITSYKTRKMNDDDDSWYNTYKANYKNMHAAIAANYKKTEIEKNRAYYDITIRKELDFLYINWQIFYSDLYSNPYVFQNLINLITKLRGGDTPPEITLCGKSINSESLKSITTKINESNIKNNTFTSQNKRTIDNTEFKKAIGFNGYYPNATTDNFLQNCTANISLNLDAESNMNIILKNITATQFKNNNRTWFIEYTISDKAIYYPVYLDTSLSSGFKFEKYTLDEERSANGIYKIILKDPFNAIKASKNDLQISNITGIFSGVCTKGTLGLSATWSECVYFNLNNLKDTLASIYSIQFQASSNEVSAKWTQLATFSSTLSSHIDKLNIITEYIETDGTIDDNMFEQQNIDQFDIPVIKSMKKEYDEIEKRWNNVIETDKIILEAVQNPNNSSKKAESLRKRTILENCKRYHQKKLIEKMYYYMNKLINEDPIYIELSTIIGRINSLCAYFNTANNIFIEWRKFIDYIYKMYDGNHSYKQTTSINILVKMDISPSLVKTVLRKYTIDGRIYLEFTFNPYKDYYAKSISYFESMKQGLIEIKNKFTKKTDDEQLNELLNTDNQVLDIATMDSYQNKGYDTELQNAFDKLIGISEQNQNSPDIFETLFLRASNIISYNPATKDTKLEINIKYSLNEFKDKCKIINQLMDDANTAVTDDDINDFALKLEASHVSVEKNIDIFSINEQFYRNPKYITFMRAICHVYCGVSISELLEIGNNHAQLMDIMISKTSGNEYNMDVLNVKDYMYHNDTIEQDEDKETSLTTFLYYALKVAFSWSIIKLLLEAASNITTTFLSSSATMLPFEGLISGITSVGGGIISTGTSWISTTTASMASAGAAYIPAGVSSGAAWVASSAAAVVSSPWVIGALVVSVFAYFIFYGSKARFRNLWNRYFDDKHKKFKQFKLCLMNNKLFGAECGFGTTLASKINNICKSKENKYYNYKFINCKTENNFTILPELVKETISIAPYIGKELYGEKHITPQIKMVRYMDTSYKKYNTTEMVAGGNFFHAERVNVQRSRNNKNSNRKSVNKRNRNNYQSGGTQSSTTSYTERVINAQCPKPNEMGNKNTETYITLDFHPKMFMKVCSADNPLKIKGTIDQCKISILDKYHATGSITEDERANKCNPTEQK